MTSCQWDKVATLHTGVIYLQLLSSYRYSLLYYIHYHVSKFHYLSLFTTNAFLLTHPEHLLTPLFHKFFGSFGEKTLGTSSWYISLEYCTKIVPKKLQWVSRNFTRIFYGNKNVVCLSEDTQCNFCLLETT